MPLRDSRRSLVLCLCIFISALPGTAQTPARSETAPGEEHWYRVDVAGTPAGWMVSRETSRGEERISEETLQMSFKRGGEEITIEMATRFVETAEGRPKIAWSRQKLGVLPIEVTYEFLPDGMRVTREQNGQVARENQPLPQGTWATPRQADVEVRRQLAAKSEAFATRTIDPSVGPMPIDTFWILEERDVELKIEDQTFRVSRWSQSMSFAPQLSTLVDVTADGVMVRSTTLVMGLEMVLVLSTRERVMALRGAPEMLVQSFIYPDVPIERPRETVRAEYEIKTETGGFPNFPTVGDQTAKNARGLATVTVALGSSPVLEGEKTDEYLAASAYLNHKDPKLRALREQALRETPNEPAVRAETLRGFVHGYLERKNLNSVLATASEVAATRAGDCTEHAVLLAALLRADGIPSRLVTGLIYVDSFVGKSKLFGYHMWTQALVGKRWIDLDATLDRRFDAAHVAFTTTALNDEGGALLEMAKIIPMIGRLEVKVLKVEHGS